MRLTVGPLPPAVYWRRRALVLGAALLVLFMIAQACMAVSASPGDQAAATSPPPTSPPPGPPPATGSPASPTPEPEPVEEDEPDEPDPGDSEVAAEASCTDDEIEVTAEAEQTTFEVGAAVRFTIRIAHAADRTCVRDVGGDHRELFLNLGTGAEKVWSSRHCDAPSGSQEQELRDGVERTHHIEFVGRNSSECNGPAAVGERLAPGEYQLFARLETAISEPLPITLTD